MENKHLLAKDADTLCKPITGGDTSNVNSFVGCLNTAGKHLSVTPGVLPLMAQIPLKRPADSQNRTIQFRTEGASEDPTPAPSGTDLKVRKGCSRPYSADFSVPPRNLWSFWEFWEFSSLQPMTYLLLFPCAPLGRVWLHLLNGLLPDSMVTQHLFTPASCS